MRNPYLPPSASVADRAPASRPRPVRWALAMMWSNFAILVAVNAADIKALYVDNPYRNLSLMSLVFILSVFVLLNVMVARAHNWARILYSMSFGLAAVNFLLMIQEVAASSPVIAGLWVFGLALNAVAVYLLFVPGRAYFRGGVP